MLSADSANRRYFHEAYRRGRHGWAIEDPSTFAVSFLKRAKKRFPGGRLLDVGCGEGRHCFAARRLGFKVIGIDYERLAVSRARHFARIKNLKGITFRRANIFALPLPPASFDVVLDYGCLHHQRKRDWRAYRAGLLRVLKPGGLYILSVFSPEFRFFRNHRRQWHIAYGAYRRCFTPEDIHTLFDRHFEILAMKVQREDGRGFWHVLMKRLSE